MILWGGYYISLFTDEENEGWSKLPKVTGLRIQAEADFQIPVQIHSSELEEKPRLKPRQSQGLGCPLTTMHLGEDGIQWPERDDQSEVQH